MKSVDIKEIRSAFGTTRDRCTLVENATEQRAVAWIRQLHSQGTFLRQIAGLLNAKGVEPKRAKKWLHSSVLRIVSRTA